MNMQFDPRRGAGVPRAWHRHARSALLCSGIALGAAGAWAQAISDVPLAVKNNVPPNLMFMIDNSGSMSNIVPSAPYDAAATYTTTCGSPESTANQIDIDVQGGVPGYRRNGSGTTLTHTSVGVGSTGCFDNAATYSARLLGDSGGRPSGYLPAAYTGHYLNWYFGNFSGPVTGWTDRKLVSSGLVETRLEVAKTSAKSVIDGLPTNISGTTNPAVRLGLSVYNGSNGGTLRIGMKNLVTPDTTNSTNDIGKTPFKSSIDLITASGATPLAETLADIGRYLSTGYDGNTVGVNNDSVSIANFLRQDGRASCLNGASCAGNDANAQSTLSRPIQYYCQRSFAFMMTDGRPQSDQAFQNNTYLRDYDGDCSGANAANCKSTNPNFDQKNSRTYESAGSDYLDDVAKALFDIDLRPNLVPPSAMPPRVKARNNLITYTIGFADLQVQNDPLLINTAAQGGGKFLSAQDGTTLTRSFQEALTDAFAKDAAASTVAVANPQITVNNISYASRYNSGSWFGDLLTFSIDTTTGLRIGAPLWSAMDKLDARTPASRKIASFDGTVGRPFTAANFAGTPAALNTNVVNYLRGERSLEGTLDPVTGIAYRSRQHVLGDLAHAEPVVVTYADGTSIVYQGGNDGMLHAFDGRTAASATTRGEELWAYVPRLVHENLPVLAASPYTHRYFVDGTPAAAQITGAGAMTRILVGGLRKGGRGYYALDITDYTAADEDAVAAKAKWEFSHTNMGYTFGKPQIVKTAAGWRVLVTSGYDNGSNLGGDGRGYVWVLDPATGGVVATMATGVGSTSSPSGLAHLARLANVPADTTTRFVYGGDLQGNVWRFDLDTFQVTRLAVLTDGSGSPQTITSAPVVGPVPSSSTKLFVYVGTGRYLADEDVPGNAGVNSFATQQQSTYGILDDTAVVSPSLPNIRGTNGATCPAGGGTGDFVCQTISSADGNSTFTATAHPVDVASKRGWYVDLPVTYSRVIGAPGLTQGGTLVFVANVPTNAACDPGGSSFVHQLNADNGGAIPRNQAGDEFFGAGSFLTNGLVDRLEIVGGESNGGAGGVGGGGDDDDDDDDCDKKNLGLGQATNTEDVRYIIDNKCDKGKGVTVPWRRIYWRSLR